MLSTNKAPPPAEPAEDLPDPDEWMREQLRKLPPESKRQPAPIKVEPIANPTAPLEQTRKPPEEPVIRLQQNYPAIKQIQIENAAPETGMKLIELFLPKQDMIPAVLDTSKPNIRLPSQKLPDPQPMTSVSSSHRTADTPVGYDPPTAETRRQVQEKAYKANQALAKVLIKINEDVAIPALKGMTAGLLDNKVVDLDRLVDDAYLYLLDEARKNPTKFEKVLQIGSEIGGSVMGAGKVAKVIAPVISGIRNFAAKTLLTRGAVTALFNGTQNIMAFLDGKKDLKTALADTGIGIAGTLLGTMPEMMIKKGIGNLIGQVGVGGAFNILSDMAMAPDPRDPRYKDGKFKTIGRARLNDPEYWKEQGISNAVNIYFAGKDFLDTTSNFRSQQMQFKDAAQELGDQTRMGLKTLGIEPQTMQEGVRPLLDGQTPAGGQKKAIPERITDEYHDQIMSKIDKAEHITSEDKQKIRAEESDKIKAIIRDGMQNYQGYPQISRRVIDYLDGGGYIIGKGKAGIEKKLGPEEKTSDFLNFSESQSVEYSRDTLPPRDYKEALNTIRAHALETAGPTKPSETLSLVDAKAQTEATDIYRRVEASGLPEETKARIINSAYLTPTGEGNKRLFELLNISKRPMMIFDAGDASVLNAANPEALTRLKYEWLKDLGDAAQLAGLRRSDAFLMGGDELVLTGPKALLQKAAYIFQDIQARRPPVVDVEIVHPGSFQRKLNEKKGLKWILSRNGDKLTASGIRFNAGYGRNKEEANEKLRLAKKDPDRPAAILEGAHRQNFDDLLDKPRAWGVEKAGDQMPDDPDVAARNIDRLKKTVEKLDPDLVRDVEASVSDQRLKHDIYSRMVRDETGLVYNRQAYDGSGEHEKPQVYVDANYLKPANETPLHIGEEKPGYKGPRGGYEAGDIKRKRFLTAVKKLIKKEVEDAILTTRGGRWFEISRIPAGTTASPKSGPDTQQGKELQTGPDNRQVSDSLHAGGRKHDDSPQMGGEGSGRTEDGSAAGSVSGTGLRQSGDVRPDPEDYFKVYLDYSSKLMIVPQEGVVIKDPEYLKSLLNEAAKSVEINYEFKGDPKQIQKIDTFLRQNNIWNLADVKQENLSKLLHRFYGMPKKQAADIAGLLKHEHALVRIRKDGWISITGIPIEAGYGANLKDAMRDRLDNKDKFKVDGGRTLDPDELVELPGPQDPAVEGAIISGKLETLPEPQKVRMVMESMDRNEQARSAYVRKVFNNDKQNPEDIASEMEYWTRFNEQGWQEQYAKEHPAGGDRGGGKVRGGGGGKSSDDYAKDLIVKALNTQKELSKANPPRWEQSLAAQQEFLFGYLGARNVARANAHNMRRKFESEILEAAKKIADDPTLPATLRRQLSKVKSVSGRAVVADLAIKLYLDTMRRPDAEAIIARNWEKLPESIKAVVVLSRHLTPEMKAIADHIDRTYKAFGIVAKDAGILSNLLDNYVSRTYTFQQKKRTGTEFQTDTTHAKARSLDSMLDIYSMDGELALKGAAAELADYATDILETIYNRMFIKLGTTLHDIANGTPLFMTKNQGPPDDYIAINVPNFKINMKTAGVWGSHVVHAPKRLATHINNIFQDARLKKIPVVKELYELNQKIKQNILQESLFHRYNLTVGHLGGSNFPLKFMIPANAEKFGLELLETMNPVVELLIYNGMTVGKPLHLGMQEYIMKAENVKTGREINRFKSQQKLFEFYGNGLKIASGYWHFMEIMKKHPELPVEETARRAADLSNADFGGLNYERMGWSKDFQAFLSFIAFAPDWQAGNLKTFFNAAIGEDPKNLLAKTSIKDFKLKILSPDKAEYRQFWVRTLTRFFIASQILNMMTTGKFTWENEKFKDKKRRTFADLFAVNLTPIYNMFSENKGQNEFYFNTGAWLFEGFELVKDPVRFARNKSSVIGRFALDNLSGQDWARRPFTSFDELVHTGKSVKSSPYEPPEDEFWPTVPSRALYTGKQVIGIPAQAVLSFVDGTMTGLEATGNIAGLRVKKTYPMEAARRDLELRKYATYQKNLPQRLRQEAKAKALRPPKEPSLADKALKAIGIKMEDQRDYSREEKRKKKMKRWEDLKENREENR